MPDRTIRVFDTKTQTGYDVLLRDNGDGTYSVGMYAGGGEGGVTQVEGKDADGDTSTVVPVLIGGENDASDDAIRLRMEAGGKARVSLYATNAEAGDSPLMVDADGDGGLRVSLYGKDTNAGDKALTVEPDGKTRISLYGKFEAAGDVPLSATEDGMLQVLIPHGMQMFHHAGAAGWEAHRGNYEEVVLPLAQDTTGGRLSDDLVNYNAPTIAVLLEVTQVNGTGTITGIAIDAKIGSLYREIAIDETGWSVAPMATYLMFSPLFSDGMGSGRFSMVVPRNFRVRVNSDSDGAGNNITYSVTVCYLN